MVKTTYIENEQQHEYVWKYFCSFHKKQKELETEDTLIYPVIPMNIALKYGILYADFMLHPTMIRSRKFYENIKIVTKRSEIADLISKLLQTELLSDSENLKISEETLKVLIKAHKILSRVNKKKDVVV